MGSPRATWLASHSSRISFPAASGGWSGRRGSNPRPTAWKAVTLPLSYSRLLLPPLPLRSAHTYNLHCPSTLADPRCARFSARSGHSTRRWPAMSKISCRRRRDEIASNGGEARIRTLVATGATDLQSVAIDRSATSPNFLWIPCVFPHPRYNCIYLTRPGSWSWRRDLNPRPADYKSAALPG